MTLKWNRPDKDCLRRKGDSEYESRTDSFNHIRNKKHLDLLEIIITSTHNNRIRNIVNKDTCTLKYGNLKIQNEQELQNSHIYYNYIHFEVNYEI